MTRKPLRVGVTTAVLLVTPAVAGPAADSVAQAGEDRVQAAACTARVTMPDANQPDTGKGKEQISNVVEVTCTGLEPKGKFLVSDTQTDSVKSAEMRQDRADWNPEGNDIADSIAQADPNGQTVVKIPHVYQGNGEPKATQNKIEGKGTFAPDQCGDARMLVAFTYLTTFNAHA